MFATYDPNMGRRRSHIKMLWFPRDNSVAGDENTMRHAGEGIEFYCWEEGGHRKDEEYAMGGISETHYVDKSYATYDRIWDMAQEDVIRYKGKEYRVVSVDSEQIEFKSRVGESRMTRFTMRRAD